jgi:hypothetical protein
MQLNIAGPTMHQNVSMTMAAMGHECFLSLSSNKSFHAIFTILRMDIEYSEQGEVITIFF